VVQEISNIKQQLLDVTVWLETEKQCLYFASKLTCLTKASQGLHIALLTVHQSTDDLSTLYLHTITIVKPNLQ